MRTASRMQMVLAALICVEAFVLAAGIGCNGPSDQPMALGFLDLTLPEPQETCTALEVLKCKTGCSGGGGSTDLDYSPNPPAPPPPRPSPPTVGRRSVIEGSTAPKPYLPSIVSRRLLQDEPLAVKSQDSLLGGHRHRKLSQATDLSYTAGAAVLTGDVRVHLIWFGDWPTPNPSQIVFETFVQNLGCSDWWSVLGQYYSTAADGSALSFVNGSLTLGTSASVAGSSIVDDACGGDGVLSVYNIVNAAIATGNVQDDSSATNIYFVVPSADVLMPDNFNDLWCGWHYYWNDPTNPLMFGLIGNPANPLGVDCRPTFAADPSSSATPNGDYQADTMINVLVHELAEVVLDPQDDTWQDANGLEGADLCEWNFGTPVSGGPSSNPYYSNVLVGGNSYLIQQLWSNDGSTCKFGNVTNVAV